MIFTLFWFLDQTIKFSVLFILFVASLCPRKPFQSCNFFIKWFKVFLFNQVRMKMETTILVIWFCHQANIINPSIMELLIQIGWIIDGKMEVNFRLGFCERWFLSLSHIFSHKNDSRVTLIIYFFQKSHTKFQMKFAEMIRNCKKYLPQSNDSIMTCLIA